MSDWDFKWTPGGASGSAQRISDLTGILLGNVPVEYIGSVTYELGEDALLGSVINNYGQINADILHYLPIAASGYRTTFVCGTAPGGGNIFGFRATDACRIYLDGVEGDLGGYVYIEPTVGAQLRLLAFQTCLSGSCHWLAITEEGTWLAGSPGSLTRVTTTGDTRITSGADTRVAY